MADITFQQVTVSDVTENSKKNFRPALITLGVLYFMMGFITCLNDTLVPFFKKGFTLSYSQSSLVQFYFFLTYGIMSVPAGNLISRIGYRNGMVTGFAIAALGALLFFPAAILHQYALFLTALFVLAVGIVMLQVAANPYITVLGPASTASSRFALIQGVGSVGTTVAPLFGAHFILSHIQESSAPAEMVRFPYLFIAALLIVIALVVAGLKLPVIKSGRSQEIAFTGMERHSVFAFRNLNLGTIGIFCYVGAEVAIGSFLTNYIADLLHTDADKANSFVSFYWGGMLVGRLCGAVLLRSLKPAIVLTCCAAAAIMLICVSVNTTGYVAVWSMIAVGLCNSVMFAIIFSLSVNGLGRFTTRASGILSTAIAGGAVVSYVQGYLIDHYSWAIAFTLPLLCYLYIIFYGLNGHRSKQVL
ncbi:MAG TPA: sugar MFS transporter [Chitinophaga sp.]|uniref:sugar MFS transporter n=1 Tax=Chitinophaga sp. TaxID=1869181 RepID=UPI002BE46D07|nr:sugar MFS transporter [Chitinophaga sp.]HVI44807.1 sugar MFS transporter [Chitinophaga sp.]